MTNKMVTDWVVMFPASAREANVDLIALRLNEFGERRPATGPGSVGHTARYVLDHAASDVLLIRA
jgi:hypothetical protein